MAAAALMLPATLTPQKTDAARGTAIVVLSSNISCSNCKTRIEKNIAFERGVRDCLILKKVDSTKSQRKCIRQKNKGCITTK